MKGRLFALPTVVCCLVWTPAGSADEVDDLILSLKPVPVDNAAWAANLLKAADGLSGRPAARARIVEKAYELGVKQAKGYPTAIRAAEAMLAAVGEGKAAWRKKLLAACKLDLQAAGSARKKSAAKAYVREALAAADELAAAWEIDEALALCQEAARMARRYAPARRDEMSLRLKDLAERRKTHQDIRRCRGLLAANADNRVARERLIQLYVQDVGDVGEAAKLITPDVSEKLRTYVPLAAKAVDDVAAEACMELGDWYLAMANSARPTSKARAMARAAAYYERCMSRSADPIKSALAKSKLARATAWRPALPAELKRGLLLHYDFDKKAGDKRVADVSGRRNDGRYEGARRVDAGRVGGACELDGAGYVAAPSTQRLRLAGAMTICVWARIAESKAKWQAIALNRRSGIESRGDFVWAIGREQMQYIYWSGDDASERSDGAPRPSAGQWHHLALVVDSAEDAVTQYVNGALAVEDRKFAKDLTVSKPLIHVGRYSDPGLIGLVDDVMIHARPLSAYEINLLYRLQGGR